MAPTVTRHALGRPEAVTEINLACDFLRMFTPTRTGAVSSYAAKHTAENLFGHLAQGYVSNSRMILAAALAGTEFTVQQGSPNVLLHIAESEHAFVRQHSTSAMFVAGSRAIRQPPRWSELRDAVVASRVPDLPVSPHAIDRYPHGVSQLVPCPFCGAGVGLGCVTSAGNEAPQAHRDRQDAYGGARATRVFLYVAQGAGGNSAGWATGDLLVGSVDRHDPTRVRVLKVFPGGHEPRIAAHHRDVEPLRVLTLAEVSTLGVQDASMD